MNGLVTGNIGSFNNSPNTVRLVHDERDRRQSSEQGDTFKTPTLCIIRIGDWPFIAVGHGGSLDRIRKGRALNDAGKNVCDERKKERDSGVTSGFLRIGTGLTSKNVGHRYDPQVTPKALERQDTSSGSNSNHDHSRVNHSVKTSYSTICNDQTEH